MGYMAFHRDNKGIRPVKPRRIAAALHLPACLLGAAVLGSTPALGQEFGTLFTSPEEREYLDFLREENLRLSQQNTFNIQEDIIPEIPVVEEEEEVDAGPAISEYKFGGIMVRLNGSRMVWLNGTQIAESNLPGNMALAESAGSMLLVIRSDGTNYQIKPGQTFNVLTGRVVDAFQSGTPQAPTGNSPAAPLPTTETAQPEADNVEDEAAQDNSAALSTPSAEDLAAVLERLGASEESVSEEQIQQALEMLTEQANAGE